jgi:hypothetical protein
LDSDVRNVCHASWTYVLSLSQKMASEIHNRKIPLSNFSPCLSTLLSLLRQESKTIIRHVKAFNIKITQILPDLKMLQVHSFLSAFHLANDLNKHKLTPCSRDFLEELIVAQLVKKFPAFHGTRRIIIVFTRARHSRHSEPD